MTSTKIIKIAALNDEWLALIENNDVYHEFHSPTNRVFQDMISWKSDNELGDVVHDSSGNAYGTWIKMTARNICKWNNKYPKDFVRLSLVGNNRKSYSRCYIANCKIRIDIDETKYTFPIQKFGRHKHTPENTRN